jgi:hypothetical protein
VDWKACLDPAADGTEVRSTHCGMAVNRQVYELLDATFHRQAPARAACIGPPQAWRRSAAA